MLSVKPAVKLPGWLLAERRLPSELSLRRGNMGWEGVRVEQCAGSAAAGSRLIKSHQSRTSVVQKSAILPSSATTWSVVPDDRPMGYLKNSGVTPAMPLRMSSVRRSSWRKVKALLWRW